MLRPHAEMQKGGAYARTRIVGFFMSVYGTSVQAEEPLILA